MRSSTQGRVKSLSSGLLDTSAIIGLEHFTEAQLPSESFISAITLAELAIGPHVTRDTKEGSRRQRRLQQLEADFDVLPFDATAAREYGVLCAAALAAGRRTHRRRALDFMIAATARANALPLYTRNARDFEGLKDLLEIVAL